jgi:hypothetical protein
MKKFVTAITRVILCSTLLLLAQTAAGYDGATLPVRAGTKMSLELLSPIDTATSKKGDKFSCRVLTPAEYLDAIVEGHIQDLKRSGKADKDSKLNLEFDSITLSDGRVAELNASVIEVFDVANVGDQGRADNEGTIKNKSRTVKTSVKRAVAGAVVGAIVGGLIAGGPGAAQGAVIGASIGVTTVLATRGPDLSFKEGTQFTVECNGPTGRKKVSPSSAPNARPVLKPRNPDLPSQRPADYTNELFTLRHPENWMVHAGSNEVSLIPERGSSMVQGRRNMTHGVTAGVAALGMNDLQKATERLIAAMLQQNSYLGRQSALQNGNIGSRPMLFIVLQGKSPITGQVERVTLNAALLSNGNVFYVLTVVPADEAHLYQTAFDDLIKTVQFR